MPQLLYTVDNLVSEVRSQLDEQNSDSIDTDLDILPSLNRGQGFAFDILARKYPEPILQSTTLTLTSGTEDYEIPESIFEDRILKIEIQVGSGISTTYQPVTRVSYRDLAQYQGTTSACPEVFCIIGRTIRFAGCPTGTYSARMWSLRNPEKLVVPQGRISLQPAVSATYCILDSAGTGLSTESDELASYVNLIDGQTGVIKGTCQIQSISDTRINFRSSPLRSTVLNRSVVAFSTLSPSADDYLCAVDGICVPYFGQPTSNFLIQFAVTALTRKLGGSADSEERVLDSFEKQVERTWAGREVTLQVARRSGVWNRTRNPYRYRR